MKDCLEKSDNKRLKTCSNTAIDTMVESHENVLTSMMGLWEDIMTGQGKVWLGREYLTMGDGCDGVNESGDVDVDCLH